MLTLFLFHKTLDLDAANFLFCGGKHKEYLDSVCVPFPVPLRHGFGLGEGFRLNLGEMRNSILVSKYTHTKCCSPEN